MSNLSNHGPFPRAPLIAAGALVVASLVTTAAVRGLDPSATQVPRSPAVAVRDLRFEDRPDGSVAVQDGGSGRVVATLAPGADNFVRGTLRSFARERRQHGLMSDAPFRLSARADGRLTIEDLATGRQVDLEAFGATNARAFARFLVADSATR